MSCDLDGNARNQKATVKIPDNAIERAEKALELLHEQNRYFPWAFMMRKPRPPVKQCLGALSAFHSASLRAVGFVPTVPLTSSRE